MSGSVGRSELTAIVLAGGRSSRFGADKLAANVDGRTVLDRAIDAVAVVAAEVIVVGLVIDRVGVRSLEDPEPFGGPLQAVARALAETATGTALLVAGDMPSLVPAVLALLADALAASSDVDAVVLAHPGDPARRQPVPAALRVAPALAAAHAALSAGDRSLVRLLGRLDVAEVDVDRWRALDPEGSTLLDIDLPEDLGRLGNVAKDHRKR